MNPSLGRNFEAMDPLEWLARMSDPIPDPGQHRTIFYGEYSSRVRATLPAPEAARVAADSPPRRRCLRAPEQDKPPPACEILRVAEAGEGWGAPASGD
jgi:hypothetical protein